MKAIFLGLFLFLASIFLMRYAMLGHAVYGDGMFYWMYARTIVIDHDLDLRDELRHHYSPEGNNTTEILINSPLTDEEKQKIYHLPIGTAVGYLPFFYLAHSVTILLGMFGLPVLMTGYTHLYQIIVGLGNVLYGVIGLCAVILLVKHFVSFRVAVGTTFVMLLGTNLVYYLGIDILNTHPLSFCLSSLFFLLYVKTFGKKNVFHWIGIGILVGLLSATRTQEILFSLLVFAESLYVGLHWYSTRKGDGLEERMGIGFAVVGFLIGFAPQLYIWQAVFGSLTSPYLARNDAFTFFTPHILGIVLNPKTGLLWYTPLFIVGMVGLLLGLKKKVLLFLLLFMFALSELYLIASWNAWDQAASYGMRMLLTSVPIYTLGVCLLVEKLLKRVRGKWIILIGIFFILLNFSMIIYFHLFVKDVTIDQGVVTRQKVLHRLMNISPF